MSPKDERDTAVTSTNQQIHEDATQNVRNVTNDFKPEKTDERPIFAPKGSLKFTVEKIYKFIESNEIEEYFRGD